MKSKRISLITRAAAIAALYAALTLIFEPISFGPMQVRISEVLTVLPAYTPAALPGLFIGCAISNLYMGSMVDVIAGSLATLIAALLSYLLRRHRFLVPLPPVVCNALVIPFVLKYAYHVDETVPFLMLTIGAGQLIACYLIGIPFMLALDRLFKSL